MKTLICFVALALGIFTLRSLDGQSNAPVILQAATPAPGPQAAPAKTPVAATVDLTQLLQQMQTTNADTIKKQEAALGTLDALQKAAEEIKIFSKRG